MTLQLALVLGLLLAAIIMFAANRPRMDVVGLLMLTALPFTGVLEMRQALAGFADPNIVLIAALFVIGEGLVRTGVARNLGDWIIRRTGSSETKVLVLLMVSACTLGAFMSSTAVTAIFIPIALRICQSTGAAPGRLMMPLSVGALISGMMTLVATAPNLVVNSELVRQGHEGFNFFAFTPFGVPILVVGIVYMLFARRFLRPGDDESGSAAGKRVSLGDWVEEYALASREHRLRIPEHSPIVGQTLSDLDLRAASGANIIAIERTRGRSVAILQPTEQSVLEAGDVLLIDLADPDSGVGAVREKFGLEELPLVGGYFNDRAQDIGMAQLIVPAESELVGKTITEARFRSRTGLTVVGMRHGKDAVTRGLLDERIGIGDTLLVVGPWRRIEGMDPDEIGVTLLRLPTEVREVLPAPGKAWHAVGCLILVVVLMATGVVPNVQAALIGCLLMGLFGCIDMASAYRSINWKTLVLIVGMMPFSIALDRTGGIDIAAEWIRSVTSGSPTFVLLAMIFVATAVLGMFISNTATAILMAPVALAVAEELGASPYPFVMIVALAASTAFMTPVSSPVNTLVVGPGRYTFGDFVKIGVPLALLVLVLCVFLVPLVFPVFPAEAAVVPAP